MTMGLAIMSQRFLFFFGFVFLYCNPLSTKTGRVCICLAKYFTVSAALLHSEVISCQASVVDVENQAGVVNGSIKHLEKD